MAPSSGGHAEGQHGETEHHATHKIVVTSPVAKDVTLTQQYVCQIRSRRQIDVCAFEGQYLQAINIKEGQEVKQGDVLFNILRTLYQAKQDADLAEA
jgi:membrane fusion protein (multidrug efflux system)